jgi:phage shock protein A
LGGLVFSRGMRVMRAEIQAVVNEIEQAMSLLRRHL